MRNCVLEFRITVRAVYSLTVIYVWNKKDFLFRIAN